MLAAAVEHARAAGATAVEAYAIDPLGERIPNPIAYGGTRSMFEEAGFRVVGERLAGRTRWPRPGRPPGPLTRLRVRLPAGTRTRPENRPGAGVYVIRLVPGTVIPPG